jgi:hypothetical protein
VQHVFDPLPPAVTVPNVKTPAALASVNVFAAAPRVVSVNNTVLVVGDAVNPMGSKAVLHADTAALILLASVVVLVLFTKPALMAGATPEHVGEPFVPAVTVPNEKRSAAFDESENVLIAAPGVRSVNVMPDVPCGATVNPGFVHMPIAVIKLLAKVERVALYWKVAVVEPVHPFEPLLPAFTDPHEKPPRFDPPAVNVPPIVVSVTVTALPPGTGALMASPAGQAAIAV